MWLVAVSKPAKESYAAQQLQNQGCDTYLPYCLRDNDKRTNTVGIPRCEVLISRYFVFRTNGLPIRTVLSTRGIHSIVKRGDGSPAELSEREYQRWHEMTSMVADFRKKAAHYVIGQQLKIEEGPFAGMMGNLLEISGGKLKIDVDLMGRSVNLVVGKDAVKSIAA